MTDERIKLLADLEFRVKQVLYLCDTLQQENSQIKSELEQTRKQLDINTKQLKQLTEKYESLKTVRTITAASVDVEMAKKKLAQLVRDVDKCINLLNS